MRLRARARLEVPLCTLVNAHEGLLPRLAGLTAANAGPRVYKHGSASTGQRHTGEEISMLYLYLFGHLALARGAVGFNQLFNFHSK